MSARDDVFAAAGKVVAAWRRERLFIPEQLEDEIIELMRAIEAMNAEPHARNTDPDTSRQGPKTVRIAGHRLEVLALLRQRPRTDEQLVACLSGQMSASGARTRRAELVRAGLVRDSGERRLNSSGRKVILWVAT
jgi:hypothetical protein